MLVPLAGCSHLPELPLSGSRCFGECDRPQARRGRGCPPLPPGRGPRAGSESFPSPLGSHLASLLLALTHRLLFSLCSVKQRCLNEQKRRRQRATKKISIFIGSFVICFGPYIITRLVSPLGVGDFPGPVLRGRAHTHAHTHAHPAHTPSRWAKSRQPLALLSSLQPGLGASAKSKRLLGQVPGINYMPVGDESSLKDSPPYLINTTWAIERKTDSFSRLAQVFFFFFFLRHKAKLAAIGRWHNLNLSRLIICQISFVSGNINVCKYIANGAARPCNEVWELSPRKTNN